MGVLVVLLVPACAGMAAGAMTWVVDGDGGDDFASTWVEAAGGLAYCSVIVIT